MSARIVEYLSAGQEVPHRIQSLADHVHIVRMHVQNKARGQSPFGHASARSRQPSIASFSDGSADARSGAHAAAWRRRSAVVVGSVVNGEINRFFKRTAQMNAKAGIAAEGTGGDAGVTVAAEAREAAHRLDEVGGRGGRAADRALVAGIVV